MSRLHNLGPSPVYLVDEAGRPFTVRPGQMLPISEATKEHLEDRIAADSDVAAMFAGATRSLVLAEDA